MWGLCNIILCVTVQLIQHHLLKILPMLHYVASFKLTCWINPGLLSILYLAQRDDDLFIHCQRCPLAFIGTFDCPLITSSFWHTHLERDRSLPYSIVLRVITAPILIKAQHTAGVDVFLSTGIDPNSPWVKVNNRIITLCPGLSGFCSPPPTAHHQLGS